MQGQQRVALVVSVDPRVPAVPRGTETRVAPRGWGVHRAGQGEQRAHVVDSPPSGQVLGFLGCPPPPGRGLGAAGAACLAREVTACQPLAALWMPEIGTQAEMEFLELAPREMASQVFLLLFSR